MESIRPKVLSTSFRGYKIAPPVMGETSVKYLLKKKEHNWIDTLSFVTALTSMTGFAVGGYGLIHDYFHDLKTGKNKLDGQTIKKIENKNYSEKFKDFGPTAQKEISYAVKNSKEEGARTITPSTKTAKIGLIFAKIGIAFSGVAGIFNGLSMGLPLMAAGESLNLAASPIIETPVGTGLFGIALAAVFSGRALENDPVLKMDKNKLAEKSGFVEKSKYIMQNVSGCAKEVWNSAKFFAKNIGGLFVKTKRKEAVDFFKDSVFSIKPKSIMIQKYIDKDGVVKIAKSFKNNPYLMHAASLVLAIGGTTLALSSLFKNKAGQKVGLKTYESGGSLDNLSLSRSGLEKAAMSSTSSGKLAGNLLGLSGAAILAGQPGVDTKWGRGTQWLGTALLFSVFAVERKGNAFKSSGAKEAFTSLIGQWSVDLTKLFPKGALKEKIGNKTRLDTIINMVKPHKKGENVEALEDSVVKGLIDCAKEALEGKKYQSDDFDLVREFEKYAKEKNIEINMENVKAAVKKEGSDGDVNEIRASLEKISDKKFQKE